MREVEEWRSLYATASHRILPILVGGSTFVVRACVARAEAGPTLRVLLSGSGTSWSEGRPEPHAPTAKARGMQHMRTQPSLLPAVVRAQARGSKLQDTQFGPMPHGSAQALHLGPRRLRRAQHTGSGTLVIAKIHRALDKAAAAHRYAPT